MATMPQPKKGKSEPKQSYSPTPTEAAPGAKTEKGNYTEGALLEQETGTTTTRYAD